MTPAEAARRLSAEAHKTIANVDDHCRKIKWSLAAAYRNTPAAYRTEGSEGADVTLWPEVRHGE